MKKPAKYFQPIKKIIYKTKYLFRKTFTFGYTQDVKEFSNLTFLQLNPNAFDTNGPLAIFFTIIRSHIEEEANTIAKTMVKWNERTKQSNATDKLWSLFFFGACPF